jgi:hypothetical protein
MEDPLGEAHGSQDYLNARPLSTEPGNRISRAAREETV